MGPRDNMVGGFRPSPPSSPFLKRNENREGRRLNQNQAKKLRLAYSAPGFYANPMFREFQETNLPAAIAREKEITKDILRKRAEMKKKKAKKQRQRQEKS